MKRQKIAVIGSGISGLASAWFLSQGHDVTVFEKDERKGGHSHTIMIPEGHREVPVDTGFMVYNEVTYPLLTRLFRELDVETKETSMSFSVQQMADGVEFNGGSLNLLFGQRRNFLRPRFWKMLIQIDRFNKETIAELKSPEYPGLSLADYVKARGYGGDFLNWYLSPMAAAVWSSPPEKIADFPAHTLMRFWHNHGFLGLDTQHPWRTVTGGSRQYVEKLTRATEAEIRCGVGVETVHSISGGRSEVVLEDGTSEEFDRVLFACHGDQALALLADPTVMEKEVLSCFTYQPNEAVVHTDETFMPQTTRCWASWNYRVETAPDGAARHSTHYWMNSLQGVSDRVNYFVSINPSKPISKAKMKRRLSYEHPLFDLRAIAAQDRIKDLHASGEESGRFFCGAWQRYGFHEDGLWSAVQACTAIMEGDPWP